MNKSLKVLNIIKVILNYAIRLAAIGFCVGALLEFSILEYVILNLGLEPFEYLKGIIDEITCPLAIGFLIMSLIWQIKDFWRVISINLNKYAKTKIN